MGCTIFGRRDGASGTQKVLAGDPAAMSVHDTRLAPALSSPSDRLRPEPLRSAGEELDQLEVELVRHRSELRDLLADTIDQCARMVEGTERVIAGALSQAAADEDALRRRTADQLQARRAAFRAELEAERAAFHADLAAEIQELRAAGVDDLKRAREAAEAIKADTRRMVARARQEERNLIERRRVILAELRSLSDLMEALGGP